ncbi:MAG TPA: inositol monophosphatase family protein [Patescibacteria group bacterium]|nr:inositol monophosphatase family protein [Patescibacteria group bacterium]
MNEFLQCAVEAAQMAGAILKEGFGTHFKTENKEGIHNLVTEYDHKAERAIIEHITKLFPLHTFLAEESGASGAKTFLKDQVRWIIDPLDGTVNFAHNIPIFCVSVAAELNGEIVAGAIYQPITDELFTATKGGGAFLNGNPLKVTNTKVLKDSILVTGFPYNVSENPNGCIDHFSCLLKLGLPIRRLGSAAIDLAYVAAGRFDGFWEVRLQPWDVAAGWLLVIEAGGKLTHYDNSEYALGEGTMLATNGKIHDELREYLQ